jgi:DNA-binding transcriptional ArsR family regulator
MINEHLPEPFERAETTELKDRMFETLSNPRRREALRYLRMYEDDSPVLIRDLAEQIAAWENDISPVEVTYKQRKRVYTSLYQSHLPRLHRYGFIEYDADRGTIELTP